MATIGGPNLEKDNLVFGYDTGYGVADNNTATRFYPGENTANLFLSPNFTNHTDTTVGTTSIVKEDFGDGKIGIRMIQEGTSDIASFSMGSYSAPSSAGTYTWSSFIHSTSTGGKVKAQVTVYVNGTRHWLTSSNTWATSVTECSHLFIATIANQWHRIENQFTLPTGTLTNLQLGSFYRTSSNFTIKLANAQFELKQHTTPFVDGTRSSTQSLIDLKRTADIDLSTVSFDSTGQPTFDGTDDKIVIADQTSIGEYTYETVVKINNSDSSYSGFGSNFKSDASGYSGVGNGWVLRLDPSGNFQVYTKNNSTTLINPISISGFRASNSNKYIHLVYTYEDGSNKIYLNGVLQQTGTGLSGETASDSTLIIGAYSWGISSQTYYLNGHQPVAKLYNTTFSAEEVKQNYNAYKNRFGI
tara:strand:- start:842 stop:2086 length:1245 start_codon:yes stop_codon:yes gene_type:complete